MGAKKISAENRRRHVRFLAHPAESLALLDFSYPAAGPFKPVFAGVALDESQSGCSLVVPDRGNLKADPFHVGQQCRIQLGKLPVLRAEIRWLSSVDPGIWKIGLHYLE